MSCSKMLQPANNHIYIARTCCAFAHYHLLINWFSEKAHLLAALAKISTVRVYEVSWLRAALCEWINWAAKSTSWGCIRFGKAQLSWVPNYEDQSNVKSVTRKFLMGSSAGCLAFCTSQHKRIETALVWAWIISRTPRMLRSLNLFNVVSWQTLKSWTFVLHEINYLKVLLRRLQLGLQHPCVTYIRGVSKQ